MIPRIRELREARGMTLKQLAELVGLDLSMVSKIERGQRGLEINRALAFARALGVRLDDLVPEPAEAAS